MKHPATKLKSSRKRSATKKATGQLSKKRAVEGMPSIRTTRSSTRKAASGSDRMSDPEDIQNREDNSLCFAEAVQAFESKEISEVLYYKHMLAHFSGLRHEEDKPSASPGDWICASIRATALHEKYAHFQVEELEATEQVFQASIRGDLDMVQSHLEKIPTRRWLLLHPLACIAFDKDHSNIMRYCIELSIELKDKILEPIRNAVFKDPDILEFLWEKNWSNIQNNPRPMVYFLGNCFISSGQNQLKVLLWLLDHGVRIPFEEYHQMRVSPPPRDVLAHLLTLNPKEILRGGMMQYAARAGDVKLVKFLLEAGSEVNRLPPSFEEIRESGPWTALYMVVQSYGYGEEYREKALEVAEVLLEHGADVNLRGIPEYYTDEKVTPLQRAEMSDDKRMLELFKGYMEDEK